MLHTSTHDQILFDHITKADSKAFELLFSKYYHQLCDFANNYVRNIEISEELVSDVFIKIWQKRDGITIRTSPKSYLFISVRNECLNYLKQEALRIYSINEGFSEQIEGNLNPYKDITYVELLKEVDLLLNTLPEQRKIIFKLNRFDDLSYKEIGEILNISVSTVQNQMVKAVRYLNDRYKKFTIFRLS